MISSSKSPFLIVETLHDATKFTFVKFFLNGASHCLENFKHTLKGAWVAVRAKATKSDSIEAYAFLRKQHTLAKLNQIKSRYPLLLSVNPLTSTWRNGSRPAKLWDASGYFVCLCLASNSLGQAFRIISPTSKAPRSLIIIMSLAQAPDLWARPPGP